MTSYFDVAVGVDACKKAKPDRAIFLYAIRRLDVSPEEAMSVGDSVKHDYEGAKKGWFETFTHWPRGKDISKC